MKTVYLVSKGRYDDYWVCAVFSTRERAAAYIGEDKEYAIEESDFDPGCEEVPHLATKILERRFREVT